MTETVTIDPGYMTKNKPNLTFTGHGEPRLVRDMDERISLAPLSPARALEALLTTREAQANPEEIEDLQVSQQQHARGEIHWLDEDDDEQGGRTESDTRPSRTSS